MNVGVLPKYNKWTVWVEVATLRPTVCKTTLQCQVLHLITKCHKFYINVISVKTLILVNRSSNLSLLNNYLLRYTCSIYIYLCILLLEFWIMLINHKIYIFYNSWWDNYNDVTVFLLIICFIIYQISLI